MGTKVTLQTNPKGYKVLVNDQEICNYSLYGANGARKSFEHIKTALKIAGVTVKSEETHKNTTNKG